MAKVDEPASSAGPVQQPEELTQAAEARMLHLINDWERAAGIKNVSFRRLRTADEHGFVRLTFDASAAGPMPAVAMLLYQVETSEIPLRVDVIEIDRKKEVGEEVQVHLQISTLARQGGKKGPTTQMADSSSPAEGGA